MPLIWRFIAILTPLLIVVGLYLFRPPALTNLTSADIVLTPAGCSTEHFILPTRRAPQISLFNQSDQAMVFTLPKIAIAKTIAPGQHLNLDLPPYIMGNFDFFCLTDIVHTSIGGMSGDDAFVCGLESATIRPYALTSGIFEIEPHDRLNNLLESRPPGSL